MPLVLNKKNVHELYHINSDETALKKVKKSYEDVNPGKTLEAALKENQLDDSVQELLTHLDGLFDANFNVKSNRRMLSWLVKHIPVLLTNIPASKWISILNTYNPNDLAKTLLKNKRLKEYLFRDVKSIAPLIETFQKAPSIDLGDLIRTVIPETRLDDYLRAHPSQRNVNTINTIKDLDGPKRLECIKNILSDPNTNFKANIVALCEKRGFLFFSTTDLKDLAKDSWGTINFLLKQSSSEPPAPKIKAKHFAMFIEILLDNHSVAEIKEWLGQIPEDSRDHIKANIAQHLQTFNPALAAIFLRYPEAANLIHEFALPSPELVENAALQQNIIMDENIEQHNQNSRDTQILKNKMCKLRVLANLSATPENFINPAQKEIDQFTNSFLTENNTPESLLTSANSKEKQVLALQWILKNQKEAFIQSDILNEAINLISQESSNNFQQDIQNANPASANLYLLLFAKPKAAEAKHDEWLAHLFKQNPDIFNHIVKDDKPEILFRLLDKTSDPVAFIEKVGGAFGREIKNDEPKSRLQRDKLVTRCAIYTAFMKPKALSTLLTIEVGGRFIQRSVHDRIIRYFDAILRPKTKIENALKDADFRADLEFCLKSNDLTEVLDLDAITLKEIMSHSAMYPQTQKAIVGNPLTYGKLKSKWGDNSDFNNSSPYLYAAYKKNTTLAKLIADRTSGIFAEVNNDQILAVVNEDKKLQEQLLALCKNNPVITNYVLEKFPFLFRDAYTDEKLRECVQSNDQQLICAKLEQIIRFHENNIELSINCKEWIDKLLLALNGESLYHVSLTNITVNESINTNEVLKERVFTYILTNQSIMNFIPQLIAYIKNKQSLLLNLIQHSQGAEIIISWLKTGELVINEETIRKLITCGDQHFLLLLIKYKLWDICDFANNKSLFTQALMSDKMQSSIIFIDSEVVTYIKEQLSPHERLVLSIGCPSFADKADLTPDEILTDNFDSDIAVLERVKGLVDERTAPVVKKLFKLICETLVMKATADQLLKILKLEPGLLVETCRSYIGKRPEAILSLDNFQEIAEEANIDNNYAQDLRKCFLNQQSILGKLFTDKPEIFEKWLDTYSLAQDLSIDFIKFLLGSNNIELAKKTLNALSENKCKQLVTSLPKDEFHFSAVLIDYPIIYKSLNVYDRHQFLNNIKTKWVIEFIEKSNDPEIKNDLILHLLHKEPLSICKNPRIKNSFLELLKTDENAQEIVDAIAEQNDFAFLLLMLNNNFDSKFLPLFEKALTKLLQSEKVLAILAKDSAYTYIFDLLFKDEKHQTELWKACASTPQLARVLVKLPDCTQDIVQEKQDLFVNLIRDHGTEEETKSILREKTTAKKLLPQRKDEDELGELEKVLLAHADYIISSKSHGHVFTKTQKKYVQDHFKLPISSPVDLLYYIEMYDSDINIQIALDNPEEVHKAFYQTVNHHLDKLEHQSIRDKFLELKNTVWNKDWLADEQNNLEEKQGSPEAKQIEGIPNSDDWKQMNTTSQNASLKKISEIITKTDSESLKKDINNAQPGFGRRLIGKKQPRDKNLLALYASIRLSELEPTYPLETNEITGYINSALEKAEEFFKKNDFLSAYYYYTRLYETIHILYSNGKIDQILCVAFFDKTIPNLIKSMLAKHLVDYKIKEAIPAAIYKSYNDLLSEKEYLIQHCLTTMKTTCNISFNAIICQIQEKIEYYISMEQKNFYMFTNKLNQIYSCLEAAATSFLILINLNAQSLKNTNFDINVQGIKLLNMFFDWENATIKGLHDSQICTKMIYILIALSSENKVPGVDNIEFIKKLIDNLYHDRQFKVLEKCLNLQLAAITGNYDIISFYLVTNAKKAAAELKTYSAKNIESLVFQNHKITRSFYYCGKLWAILTREQKRKVHERLYPESPTAIVENRIKEIENGIKEINNKISTIANTTVVDAQNKSEPQMPSNANVAADSAIHLNTTSATNTILPEDTAVPKVSPSLNHPKEQANDLQAQNSNINPPSAPPSMPPAPPSMPPTPPSMPPAPPSMPPAPPPLPNNTASIPPPPPPVSAGKLIPNEGLAPTREERQNQAAALKQYKKIIAIVQNTKKMGDTELMKQLGFSLKETTFDPTRLEKIISTGNNIPLQMKNYGEEIEQSNTDYKQEQRIKENHVRPALGMCIEKLQAKFKTGKPIDEIAYTELTNFLKENMGVGNLKKYNDFETKEFSDAQLRSDTKTIIKDYLLFGICEEWKQKFIRKFGAIGENLDKFYTCFGYIRKKDLYDLAVRKSKKNNAAVFGSSQFSSNIMPLLGMILELIQENPALEENTAKSILYNSLSLNSQLPQQIKQADDLNGFDQVFNALKNIEDKPDNDKKAKKGFNLPSNNSNTGFNPTDIINGFNTLKKRENRDSTSDVNPQEPAKNNIANEHNNEELGAILRSGLNMMFKNTEPSESNDSDDDWDDGDYMSLSGNLMQQAKNSAEQMNNDNKKSVASNTFK